jgi:hypothetical protein
MQNKVPKRWNRWTVLACTATVMTVMMFGCYPNQAVIHYCKDLDAGAEDGGDGGVVETDPNCPGYKGAAE